MLRDGNDPFYPGRDRPDSTASSPRSTPSPQNDSGRPQAQPRKEHGHGASRHRAHGSTGCKRAGAARFIKGDPGRHSCRWMPARPGLGEQMTYELLTNDCCSRSGAAEPGDIRDRGMPSMAARMMETRPTRTYRQGRVPQTAELEARCVNIIAELWHADESRRDRLLDPPARARRAMLAGLALKWRWRERGALCRQADRSAKPRDGHQRPGLLGEVHALLGRRAAPRADGGRPLSPQR